MDIGRERIVAVRDWTDEECLNMINNKKCGTEEVLYRVGLAAALVAAAGCLLWQWAPKELHDWWHRYSFCVMYRFTGFLCPGCGGTRAFTALLQGHVWESFLYHPLVIYGVVWYVCFMGSHTLAWVSGWLRRRKGHGAVDGVAMWPESLPWYLRICGMKWKNQYLTVALALLVGNFIIKNLIHLITGVDVLAWLGQQFAA